MGYIASTDRCVNSHLWSGYRRYCVCLILSNLTILQSSITPSSKFRLVSPILSVQRISSRGNFLEETFHSIRDSVGWPKINSRRWRERERDKRDGERPEATKLLYPTFILLFPASSPRDRGPPLARSLVAPFPPDPFHSVTLERII